MIKFTGPEDRIIRAPNGVTDKVPDGVSDKVTESEKQLLMLLAEDSGCLNRPMLRKLLKRTTCITSAIVIECVYDMYVRFGKE